MNEHIIIGMDPARGDDRTVIVAGRRNGTAFEIQAIQEIEARRIKLLQDEFGKYVVTELLQHIPVKWHRRRRWMSLAYHRRIQKKWNKRFGTMGNLPPIIIDCVNHGLRPK